MQNLHSAPYLLLFTAAAGFAVAAAFFYGFACGGKHLPAVAAFGNFAAIGAYDGVVVFFHKLFKSFIAAFTEIL